jgi:hypothetical protein
MAQEAQDPRIAAVETHIEKSDSIYALTVTTVVKLGWGDRQAWRLVAALLFTVFLQLALVGLLFEVRAKTDGFASMWQLSRL